jgi:hypothetical protein
VRMLERIVCVLCLVPRDKLKESKAARATVKALRQTDGLELAVRTGKRR